MINFFLFITFAFPKAGMIIKSVPITLQIILFGICIILCRKEIFEFLKNNKKFTIAYIIFTLMLLIVVALNINNIQNFYLLVTMVLIGSPLAIAIGKKADYEKTMKILCIALIITSLYSILQWTVGIEATKIQGLNIAYGDSFKNKPIGYGFDGREALKMPSTYQNGNLVGIFFILAIACMIEWKNENTKYNILRFISIILGIEGIMLSGSRTAMIAYILFIVLALIYKVAIDKVNRKKTIKYTVYVIIGLFILFQGMEGLSSILIKKQENTINNNIELNESKETNTDTNNDYNIDAITDRYITQTISNKTATGRTEQLKELIENLKQANIIEKIKTAIRGFSWSNVVNIEGLLYIFSYYGAIALISILFIFYIIIIKVYKIDFTIATALSCIIIAFLVDTSFNYPPILINYFIIAGIYLNQEEKREKRKKRKKDKLIIGIDGRALTKNRTGIGTYTHEIIKELNELDNTNTYYIYSNKKIYIDFELKENFKVCQMNSKIGTFWLYFLLPKQLKKDEVDVFWGTQHCLPKRNENTDTIKYVLTVHDMAIEKFKNIGSLYNTLIQKLVLKKSCKNADKIIADSNATKKDIVDIFKIDEEKIKTVYLGTNFNNEYNISEKEEKKILKKFDIEDKMYLFFVSTIEPRKNIVTLIKAFEVLKEKQENKTLKLILAGGLGWKYQDVLDTIENSKFKEEINLVGYISKEEKECLLKNTKCFVYPSLYEGFGLPILEAMSKEAIVVTSNISSIPEVGGDAAIYFNNVYDYSELSERIEIAMIMDEEERNKYINLGKYQVSKFNWEKCANQVIKLLI